MFTVYYSNRLSSLAEMLIHVQKVAPNPDPLKAETILVQSVGMAQWLQMQIAAQTGVAGNYRFPFPTSFLWQQYRLLFPSLPKENIFERMSVTWRLMRLIPRCLTQPAFSSLKAYLTKDDRQQQLKLFQLSEKIADLFDQYLVYRPHWLVHWENNRTEAVFNEIKNASGSAFVDDDSILADLNWQSALWNALINDIKSTIEEEVFLTSHRAYLQAFYFDKLEHLNETERNKLPQRIFVFGISSLPATQLAVLKKLSEYCDVNIFFLNPSQSYWGDNIEDKVLEKWALKQKLSEDDLTAMLERQGNQLLAMWGKQGREFLAQLVEQEPNQIEAFSEYTGSSNLVRLKKLILDSNNQQVFRLSSQDHSVQFHSCHSILREVEVLHNNLLRLFETNPDLSPKDIIVMSANIDRYAPYINAVFSRYDKSDKRYIPFSLSDQKISVVDPIIAGFLTILDLKESNFTAESLLDFLDINSVRDKFNFSQEDLSILRYWIQESGIRMGLETKQAQWNNYNSWENGLTRLLLGNSLKAENGIWQGSIAFDGSYGLASALVGNLAKFIDILSQWHSFIRQSNTLSDWEERIRELIVSLFADNEESLESLLLLNNAIDDFVEKIREVQFDDKIDIEIISLFFKNKLNEKENNLHFLSGKVNFCTLLPMRAIPFRVVCLLGMNEADFPRNHSVNSFDLMQFAPKRGDRARRDDDRYLFLEALLSAQDIFYVSYIGQSPTDNKQYLPSVLVVQLLDYLFEYLHPDDKLKLSQNEDPEKYFREKLVKRHPMTIFSPHNFTQGNYSYDKEWLEITHREEQGETFINEAFSSENELPTEVQLDDLISFIRHPVKYFFNKQLGIYFSDHDESIEEAEKFELNGLDLYKLREKLVTLPTEKTAEFFREERLKGGLPAAHFWEKTANTAENMIKPLRESIAAYTGENEIVEIKKTYNIQGYKLDLYGNIPNKFGNEIVFWKVSALKDNDIIRLWIYTLLLAQISPELKIKYIFCHDGGVETFTFSEISVEKAEKQLNIYLEDYLKSFRYFIWAVSNDLDNYFKHIPPENVSEYCHEKINALAEDPYFDAGYLSRILQQSGQTDYSAVHDTTLRWFELMQTGKPTKRGK